MGSGPNPFAKTPKRLIENIPSQRCQSVDHASYALILESVWLWLND